MPRIFKTAWFTRAARKARISDNDLARAIEQVERRQVDDLGGGVFKKRLNDNRHRSIIIARHDEYWVFVYLFAKQDRANIEADELEAFRRLAALYRRKTDVEIQTELGSGALQEVRRDD